MESLRAVNGAITEYQSNKEQIASPTFSPPPTVYLSRDLHSHFIFSGPPVFPPNRPGEEQGEPQWGHLRHGCSRLVITRAARNSFSGTYLKDPPTRQVREGIFPRCTMSKIGLSFFQCFSCQKKSLHFTTVVRQKQTCIYVFYLVFLWTVVGESAEEVDSPNKFCHINAIKISPTKVMLNVCACVCVSQE